LAARVGFASIGVARLGPARIAEALADLWIAIRDVAAMPGIVTPCIVGDLGAIELVEAIDVDIDAIPPPVEVAPNRRADGNRGGKRQYAATGEAGRIPIVGFVLWVGPTPARDGVAMRAVTLSVLFRIAPGRIAYMPNYPS
jgi:hypothetical protein